MTYASTMVIKSTRHETPSLKVYFKRTNVNHRFALLSACDKYHKRSKGKGVVIVGAKNLIFYFFVIMLSPKRVCLYLTGFGRLYTDFGEFGRLFLLSILKFYMLVGVQKFIVENYDDKKVLVDLFDRVKVEVVNGSGFSQKGFEPRRRPPDKKLFIGCLSRFGAAKHTCQIKKLAADIPSEFFLKVAGEDISGQKYSEEFAKIAKHKPNVEYIGYLGSKAEISEFFNSIDVLIYPSKREGLPITLLESALHRVPFLTTDVPGCRQLAVEFDYPMLKASDFGDWNSIVKAAEALKNTPNFPEDKLKKYQESMIADKFEGILERLFNPSYSD